jgi:4-coumarate--CoA ligase
LADGKRLPQIASSSANHGYPAIFIDGYTGRSYSRSQIRQQATAFGQGLKHLWGWSKGDVLGFFTPNNVDTPVVNLGLQWAGGVASPANPTYTPDELARQLTDAGAKALVTQKPVLAAALEAATKAGLPRDRVLLLGDERDDTGEFRHWTDITAKGAWIQPRRPRVSPSDLAYLVYSSVGVTLCRDGVSSKSANPLVGHDRSTQGRCPHAWQHGRQFHTTQST